MIGDRAARYTWPAGGVNAPGATLPAGLMRQPAGLRATLGAMLFALALALSARPALAQRPLVDPKVEVEFDKSTDFSRYHTFAWASFDEPVPDPAQRARLMRAIESVLADKGLEKAEGSARADLYVQYHVKTEKKVRGKPSRGESVWQPSSPRFSVDFRRVEVTTLTIQLWDVTRGDRVFQARGEEPGHPADEQDELAGAAVRRLLATYPPKRAHKPE